MPGLTLRCHAHDIHIHAEYLRLRVPALALSHVAAWSPPLRPRATLLAAKGRRPGRGQPTRKARENALPPLRPLTTSHAHLSSHHSASVSRSFPAPPSTPFSAAPVDPVSHCRPMRRVPAAAGQGPHGPEPKTSDVFPHTPLQHGTQRPCPSAVVAEAAAGALSGGAQTTSPSFSVVTTTGASSDEPYAAQYERALALARKERFAEAREAFEELLSQHPQACKVWVSYAQMEKRIGSGAKGSASVAGGRRPSASSVAAMAIATEATKNGGHNDACCGAMGSSSRPSKPASCGSTHAEAHGLGILNTHLLSSDLLSSPAGVMVASSPASSSFSSSPSASPSLLSASVTPSVSHPLAPSADPRKRSSDPEGAEKVVWWSGCREVLQRGLARNPHSSCLTQAWGLLELQRSNWWAALRLLERCVAQDPRCAPVLTWRRVVAARRESRKMRYMRRRKQRKQTQR